MVLAKNSGKIVLTSEGHRQKRCRLHCKRNIICQARAWSRWREARPLGSAKKSKTFDANKPAASGGVGSRFWNCVASLSLNRLRVTRRFTVKQKVCVYKRKFLFLRLDVRYEVHILFLCSCCSVKFFCSLPGPRIATVLAVSECIWSNALS